MKKLAPGSSRLRGWVFISELRCLGFPSAGSGEPWKDLEKRIDGGMTKTFRF